MATKVGTKGQFVIEKRLRDELGIGPGWMAVQRAVDGQLRVSFVPPVHEESLFGILSHYADKVPPPSEEEIAEAAAIGMADEWARSEGLLDDEEPEKVERSSAAA